MLMHVPEPRRLLLTWQQPSAERRSRRVVAELVKIEDVVTFRYLVHTDDFDKARAEGFRGFPAFDLETVEHRHNVMEALMRRLPPKKREDYANFLKQHLLPVDFSGSDFALLGITGARLPSDTFELSVDLEGLMAPLDMLLVVAGHRFHVKNLSKPLEVGTLVRLVEEPTNEHDANAVQVIAGDDVIGYVNRAACAGLKNLLRTATATATVARLNGTPDSPRVYVLVRFT